MRRERVQEIIGELNEMKTTLTESKVDPKVTVKKILSICDVAWGALAGSMTGAGTERFENAMDSLKDPDTFKDVDALKDALNELYFGADEILFKAGIKDEDALEEFSKHWDKAYKLVDALTKSL